MSLEGTVVNGAIVLDGDQKLPEGARVEIVITSPSPQPTTLGEMLLRHAGKAVGQPEDLAVQHDHYLHGTAKR